MDVNGGDEIVGKLSFWGLYLGLERQGVEPNKAKKQGTHSLRFKLRAGDGQATTLSSRKKTKKQPKKKRNSSCVFVNTFTKSQVKIRR